MGEPLGELFTQLITQSLGEFFPQCFTQLITQLMGELFSQPLGKLLGKLFTQPLGEPFTQLLPSAQDRKRQVRKLGGACSLKLELEASCVKRMA
jgi:hypothetical protein